MALATDCPHCKKEFKLPDELFGKRIKCKSCGGVFRVGGASAPPTADEFNARDAVDRTQGGVPALDGPAGPERAMPGMQADDFETAPPPTRGDDFATSYGAVDDFQTAVPPTSQDFSDTVLPAPESAGADTWGDTADGGGHFASS